jgi:hypothetical protein
MVIAKILTILGFRKTLSEFVIAVNAAKVEEERGFAHFRRSGAGGDVNQATRPRPDCQYCRE